MSRSTETLLETLGCPAVTGGCGRPAKVNGDLYFECATCGQQFPIVADGPRWLQACR